MNIRSFRIISLLSLTLLSGCVAASTPSAGDYSLDRVRGLESLSGMSASQYHSAIEVAYLDGQLTKEEAARAHRQLDRQGL
jgi:hypothetical protein